MYLNFIFYFLKSLKFFNIIKNEKKIAKQPPTKTKSNTQKKRQKKKKREKSHSLVLSENKTYFFFAEYQAFLFEFLFPIRTVMLAWKYEKTVRMFYTWHPRGKLGSPNTSNRTLSSHIPQKFLPLSTWKQSSLNASAFEIFSPWQLSLCLMNIIPFLMKHPVTFSFRFKSNYRLWIS